MARANRIRLATRANIPVDVLRSVNTVMALNAEARRGFRLLPIQILGLKTYAFAVCCFLLIAATVVVFFLTPSRTSGESCVCH